MMNYTITHKVRTSTAIAALLLISSAGARLISQTDASQPPTTQLAPVAPTVSLGETIRSTKLESDDPDIRYQNGFFFNFDGHGHILIRDKDGHVTGDFNLRPLEKETAASVGTVHDAAVFKDGSIAASWVYGLPHDNRRYFYLVHYDPTGKFLEQIDLGRWRALKVCIAGDKSIWTLSEEEELGRPVYSPDGGVLRNYKFGAGLVRAVVPRSDFQPNDSYSFPSYPNVHVAIDCSGDKIHALTGDGKWIEYTPGADFTITNVEPFSHSTYGNFWRMVGFAYLNGRAYAVIHSVPGDPFQRMLSELLPSADGKSLRWVELPSDKTLPAHNQPPDAAYPSDQPKELIAVTGILGADHEDGEQLVYRTSKDQTVLWSKPLFGIP